MTNPSSSLTKFPLILEEYDFSVEYIKDKNNMIANALSRIEITSNELKNLSTDLHLDENIYVTTRSMQSQRDEKGNFDTTLNDRLDHPGLVEVLKRPRESFELRLTSESEKL